ncbi:hypothetical protein [Brachyspira aalborgi]|uniref:hypothetical protein n=1 Tax=Brachyspira aalborgi TaxID=29522 RepID=UPI002666C6B4|nr:hypothetical protein [Brachyspira aalborgi]
MYVRKDKHNEIKIIVKNILDEYIDLSIYWSLVIKKFLWYCSTKTFDLYFLIGIEMY